MSTHGEVGDILIAKPSNFAIRLQADNNVLAKLPTGSKILSAVKFGHSLCGEAYRLHVSTTGCSDEEYFCKVIAGSQKQDLLEGEFHSMLQIHTIMPNFAPKPLGWGKLDTTTQDDMCFFLSEYVNMTASIVPDPNALCPKVAQLHRESISPTGKFGFAVPTPHGAVLQNVPWQTRWTPFFSDLLRDILRKEKEVDGDWNELMILEDRIFASVIPRLIGNLEADGRSIKPCLIHGDMWEGNVGMRDDTGEMIVFDAGSYYAHNEMELGKWRVYWDKMCDPVLRETYFKHFPPSEPADESDDRTRLYCIYFLIAGAANRGNLVDRSRIRQEVYSEMWYLVEKYCPFSDKEKPPKMEIIASKI